MKRAKRDRALSQLYADVESGDFDIREFAMFQLALMLRRSDGRAPSSEQIDEDEHLTRDQLRIRLSSDDQAQVASHLLRVVSRHADSSATAFWALCEVASDVAFGPALSVIGDYGEQFNDEAAYQACRALRRWLEMDSRDRRLLKELKGDDGVWSCLKRWSCSGDIRLAKNANAIINRAREGSN